MENHERDLLAKLSKAPEWVALTAQVKAMMEMHFQNLAVNLMTKDKDISYGELQYRRGVFAGMKLILDTPHIEAAALERELAKGALSGEE